MVANLFQSSQIVPEEFHRQGKQSIRKTFDVYIQPFSLSEEEKLLRSGLGRIMSTQLDPNASIVRIPLEQLQSVLHLEVPKRVIQYVPSSVPIVDPANKPKQVRAKGVRGQQRPFKTVKRALPEVASIYADADDAGDGEQQTSKKARLSGRGGANEEEEYERRASSGAGTHGRADAVEEEEEEDYRRRSAKSSTPSNFYAVVGPLFDEFWRMEFDNVQVTWAFFALITNMNCKDYQLEVFAEQSYSLAVIKDKLKAQAYCSIEDFVYDFNQLFTNIFTYYPASHEAVKKAVELSKLFEDRWKEILPKFR